MPVSPYNPTLVNNRGLGCSRFARRYSGNRGNLLPKRNGASASQRTRSHPFRKKAPTYCFLFLQVLRCFTSLCLLLVTEVTVQRQSGFPIQRPPDQRLIGTSPKRIAAIPRLSSLTLAKASTIHPSIPNGNVVHRCTFLSVGGARTTSAPHPVMSVCRGRKDQRGWYRA